jgi:beta-lactamase class C
MWLKCRPAEIEDSTLFLRPSVRHKIGFAAVALAMWVGVCVGACAAPSVAAATKLTVPVPPTSPLQREVAAFEQLCDEVVATGQVVGMAVAVVKDGTILSQRGYGVTQFGGTEAVTEHTVFRLASLSKAFASTLAALLVDAGYISWDDAIKRYLPYFELRDARQAERLTVRDVLSHRVGIPHNSVDLLLERDEPYPLLLYKLRELPMTCAVGDCYAYQNIAYSMIGDVVFATTGDFYHHQVERLLFHPLGMTSATFGRDSLEASASWARPHVRERRSWRVVRPKETYYRVMPAAGVNASLQDMTQWLLAQLGHQPDALPRSVLATIQTPQVVTPGETLGSPWRRERVRAAQYALGWRVYDYAGQRLLFHAGAVQGYRGMIALLPEHDFGVVVLWNNESGVPAGLMPTLLDRYLGMPAHDWLELSRFPKPRALAARARTTPIRTHRP